MTRVYLSLGSNIEREKNIAMALDALRKKFPEIRISPVYESEAVGFKGDSFFNLIVAVETELTLSELSVYLKELENNHGRNRKAEKFSPRTLDIDIVLFGQLVGNIDGIELPRPELYFNAFVLQPLADLDPLEKDPNTNKTYAELWGEFSGNQRLWQVPFPIQN